MLSQCANSQCGKPFLNLRQGKLFVIEADVSSQSLTLPGSPFVRIKLRRQRLEHFWLCDECAGQWTLISNPGLGIEMAPLRKPMGRVRTLDGIACGITKPQLRLVPPGA
jgi:hypothetical protein